MFGHRQAIDDRPIYPRRFKLWKSFSVEENMEQAPGGQFCHRWSLSELGEASVVVVGMADCPSRDDHSLA
jgi:hypothetical protein